VNIDPRQLNDAIHAAGREERGSIVQRLILLCYHYNPITGRYSGLIISILRVAGIATVMALIAFVVVSARRSRSTSPPSVL
jgi:protein SCO1